jgi:hypothetical protein
MKIYSSRIIGYNEWNCRLINNLLHTTNAAIACTKNRIIYIERSNWMYVSMILHANSKAIACKKEGKCIPMLLLLHASEVGIACKCCNEVSWEWWDGEDEVI